MARTLYELLGRDDRRFSPNCWRTRMALAHKGLACDYEPCAFTQKEKIAFSDYDRYPVLRDGDKTVTESWDIACYLEDAYPDRPSLFGGDGGRHLTRFFNCWADTQLHPTLIRVIIFDIFQHLEPDDIEYFRSSREARFGQTLEDMGAEQDARAEALDPVLAPPRALLAQQRWIGGDAPAYGDYILFSALQWARSISAYPVVKPGDAIHEWRGRMIGLFDGLADTVPHYDY